MSIGITYSHERLLQCLFKRLNFWRGADLKFVVFLQCFLIIQFLLLCNLSNCKFISCLGYGECYFVPISTVTDLSSSGAVSTYSRFSFTCGIYLSKCGACCTLSNQTRNLIGKLLHVFFFFKFSMEKIFILRNRYNLS